MTLLPQLEQDLFNAAEERLRRDATAPHRRSSSLLASLRARLGRAAASLALVLSVAVAVAVAVIAVAVLGHGRHAGPSATASGPSGGSPRAELVRSLGVLRRPQTKADLRGLEQLDRDIRALPKKGWVGPRLKDSELDRPLARVVNVPVWRAKVLIAPTRSQPSPTSGQRAEGVHLALLWPKKTAFPSLVGSRADTYERWRAARPWSRGGPRGARTGPDPRCGARAGRTGWCAVGSRRCREHQGRAVHGRCDSRRPQHESAQSSPRRDPRNRGRSRQHCRVPARDRGLQRPPASLVPPRTSSEIRVLRNPSHSPGHLVRRARPRPQAHDDRDRPHRSHPGSTRREATSQPWRQHW